MSTAAKFRRHAADCFRLAQSMSAPKDWALLTEMVAMWLRLADRSEIIRGRPEAMTSPWQRRVSLATTELKDAVRVPPRPVEAAPGFELVPVHKNVS